jgi:hypothetical protein
LAWLGLAAIVGLVVCGLSALHDALRARKARSLRPGEVLPPSWWTGRRLAIAAVASVAVVAGAIAALVLAFGGGSTTPRLVTAPTTTSTTTALTSTTTGGSLPPARPPQQVRVDVLNGSGAARAATVKASALASTGYRIVNVGNAPVQQGSVVECVGGFASDAVVLARAVGPGTLVQGFPITAPPGSANADCVVVLGQ